MPSPLNYHCTNEVIKNTTKKHEPKTRERKQSATKKLLTETPLQRCEAQCEPSSIHAEQVLTKTAIEKKNSKTLKM